MFLKRSSLILLAIGFSILLGQQTGDAQDSPYQPIEGPFKFERSKLSDQILELKQNGAGVVPYTNALRSIDEQIQKGSSEEEVKVRLDSLQRAITQQVQSAQTEKKLTQIRHTPMPKVAEFRAAHDTDESEWPPYVLDVTRRIRRAWFPPHTLEGTSIVLFRIHQNGTMSNLVLGQSSKFEALDLSALKAVQDASPFRPLPKDNDTSTFKFEFRANTKEQDGKGSIKASRMLPH